MATALLPDHPPAAVHLAKDPAQGLAGRRPRAHRARMVGGRRGRPVAGLLPRRDRARRPLLAVSGRSDRRGRALVAARIVRVSRYAELQVTTHFSFLRGASSPRGALRSRRSFSASRRSPSPTAIPSPASCGPTRPRRETGVRLVVGCRLDLTDGTVAPGLSHRPRRLFAPVPAAQPRQEPGRQGQVPPRLGGCRRVERGPARDPARRRGG